MKTRFIFLLPVLLFAWCARGQYDATLLYGSRHDILATSLFPARLGMAQNDGFTLVLPFLPSLHAGVATDWARVGDIKDFLNGDGDITNAMVDDYLQALPRSIGSQINFRYDAFAMGIPIMSGKGENQKERFTFSLRWTERALTDIAIGKGALELAWQGNASFSGQAKDLTPLDGFAQAWREWAFGIAIPMLQLEDWELRLGAQAKYLTGYGAVSLATQEASLLTAASGESISASIDAELQAAGWPLTPPENVREAILGAGAGFGIDAGLSLRYADRWTLDLGLVDIGSIRYRDSAEVYRVNGNFFFEGIDLTVLNEDGLGNPLDSLLEDFAFDTTLVAKPSFQLPTQWSVRLGYGVPVSNRKGRPYYRHQVYVHVVQRRAPGPGSRARTSAGLSYLFNAGDVIELGSSMGYGPGKWNWSALMGFRFGAFRWTLSSHAPSLLLRSSRLQADLSTRMALVF